MELRILSTLLISLFTISTHITVVSAIVDNAGVTYSTDILEDLGIDIPRKHISGHVETHYYSIDRFEVNTVNEKYVLVILENEVDVDYMAIPGKPILPYIAHTLIIDGYVEEAGIYINPLNARFIEIGNKILPAPRPIVYRVNNSMKPIYEPDIGVYGLNKYFPGRLGDINIRHGLLGKSIVSIKIYPVQYNPVENRVVIVDKFTVSISYRNKISRYLLSEKNLLVITRPQLVDLVNKTLGDFYRTRGYGVTVVNTDHIYRNYPPDNPIIEFPGFYNPPYVDDVYRLLRERYNYTLALKIMRYLETTLGNYSHVLLIGDAIDIPPSFYYAYRYNYIEPYENWIPTDFFYSDLDRDLAPDLYVGRIPFSDLREVNYTVNKLINWYNTSASRSDELYMAGGYTFLLPLMFGETALSTMVLHGETSSFKTTLLTRTSYNYSSETILSVLRGDTNALWFYIIAHGLGNTLLDLLVKPGEIGLEILVTSRDLLTMQRNLNIPVVSSVACAGGAWDTEIVPSYYFDSPSIGEAVLLSPAGGVAYLGSSRVAYEILGPFIVQNGLLFNEYYGASLLHRKIISTYNRYRALGINVSLGRVLAEGVVSYISEALTGDPLLDDIVLSEIFKLILLGDPLLQLPVPVTWIDTPRIHRAESVDHLEYIDASTLFYAVVGHIPFYKTPSRGFIKVEGVGSVDVDVFVNKITGSYDNLYYHVLVKRESFDIRNGIGYYRVVFDDKANGFVLVKFIIHGWGEVRFITTSIGLNATPTRTTSGGLIRVEGFGLDILGGAREVELLFAGRIITRIPLDIYGCFNWEFTVPYVSPGTYNITIYMPIDYYRRIPRLTEYISTRITIYSVEKLDIYISGPVTSELGRDISLLVTAVIGGEHVDPVLDVVVLNPGNVRITPLITRIDSGIYLVVFNATELGAYRVLVRGVFENTTMSSRGLGVFSTVVIDELYNTGELVKNESRDIKTILRYLNDTFSRSIGSIVNEIRITSEKLVVIDTKLGEITGRIVELRDGFLVVNTTIGKLFIKLDEIESDIRIAIEESSINLSDVFSGKIEKIEEKTSLIYILIGALTIVIAISTTITLTKTRRLT